MNILAHSGSGRRPAAQSTVNSKLATWTDRTRTKLNEIANKHTAYTTQLLGYKERAELASVAREALHPSAANVTGHANNLRSLR